MRFIGFLKLEGELEVVTGLHIGGVGGGVTIGATDNPIIRCNGDPYIPGSSLKGKIRSLLELNYGKEIDDDLGRHECKKGNGACDLCIVFGRSADRKANEGPTRAIFRDCYLNKDKSDESARKNGYVEIKMENAINRLTSKVEKGLRDAERVLPGTIFDIKITFRVFDSDADPTKMKNLEKIESLPEPLKSRFSLILEGMRMLEEDYLGGMGSRGYGKVKFGKIKIEYIPVEYFKNKESRKTLFEGNLWEIAT